ncbi:hypothetical protein B1C78_12220, partial [Thioalkalivibrio denitrificans]
MKTLLIAMFAAGALGAGAASAGALSYGQGERDKDKEEETRDYMEIRDGLQMSGVHEEDEKDEDQDRQ